MDYPAPASRGQSSGNVFPDSQFFARDKCLSRQTSCQLSRQKQSHENQRVPILRTNYRLTSTHISLRMQCECTATRDVSTAELDSDSSAGKKPAACCGSWRAPFRFSECIETMNPPPTPPRRGAERFGQFPSWEGSGVGSLPTVHGEPCRALGP